MINNIISRHIINYLSCFYNTYISFRFKNFVTTKNLLVESYFFEPKFGVLKPA